MTEKTTTTRETVQDVKERTKKEPKAVEQARRKVKGHVQADKPGPGAEHVDSAPDTKPSES